MVETPEADEVPGNWLYSGPGVIPPDPRRKVWRQNAASGACEELVLAPSTPFEMGTYFAVARAQSVEGGWERLPSKDFPPASASIPVPEAGPAQAPHPVPDSEVRGEGVTKVD